MKRFRRMLAAICLILIGLVALPASPAQATSDYDDLLQTTTDLKVYTEWPVNSGTPMLDVSRTWWRDLQQAYQARLNQNIGWPADFVPLFTGILEHGSWGIFTRTTPDGVLLEIVGSEDPDASCSFVGTSTTGTLRCFTTPGYESIHVEYFTHSAYGRNGCGYAAYVCSDNGMSLYTEPHIYPANTASDSFLSIPVWELSEYEFHQMNFDIDYPAGYIGEIMPRQQQLNYVALGDSFSSGEGVEPFLVGTDEDAPNENRCHRSEDAYPMLLDEDKSQAIQLNLTAFVACSGATTSNITVSGQWGEARQLDAIDSNTDIVTLTIGGNDAGFASFMEACFEEAGDSCDSTSSVYSDTRDKIMSELPSKLFSLLEAIQTKIGPSSAARILIVGYPAIISASSTSPITSPWSCVALLTTGDLAALQSISSDINDVTKNALLTLDDSRFVFIDPMVGDDTFATHDMCNNDWYIYPYDFGRPHVYVAHPTRQGQRTLASIISEYL